MTAKEKAQQLVVQYKIVLMDEDTDCGNEILCTTIAKKIALTTVDEMMDVYASAMVAMGIDKDVAELTPSPYLLQVKQEIENL